jgi:hypothetical protein
VADAYQDLTGMAGNAAWQVEGDALSRLSAFVRRRPLSANGGSVLFGSRSYRTLFRRRRDLRQDDTPERVEFSRACASCAPQFQFDALDRVGGPEARDELRKGTAERTLQQALSLSPRK